MFYFKSGVGCGIYTTNSSEACEYVLKDSQAPIVVVENAYQLNKIVSSKNRTNVKKIIQYSDYSDYSRIIYFNGFEKLRT